MEGPSRESMLEDICHYWTQHSNLLTNQDQVSIASLFMKKIVVSNYVQLVEYIRAVIASIEYRLSRRQDLNMEIPWVEEQWSDLQAIARRIAEYSEDVEAIMLGLGIPLEAPNPTSSDDWLSCTKDYQLIYHRLKTLRSRVELLVSSMTGLAGIVGNKQAVVEARRSLREAKSVKTLTILGMVFIPLAYCCGLFSMNEAYLPGRQEFWVYFSVSLPMIICVFLAAFLIDLGYRNDGVWSLPAFLARLQLKVRDPPSTAPVGGNYA